ncbi:hypothetical protein CYY_008251 [Polysphondylium violaceum]|uniref:GATA-type domain-containing protein n=1 Tax=Polysphondylium violaceum TaxID=133409 RepID=A0A8J4UXF6_9MYCE|nr:hypothetical protein CYY_008251 [Polysphondylium violaceum]
MDYQQHSGKQMATEFPQRSQEMVGELNAELIDSKPPLFPSINLDNTLFDHSSLLLPDSSLFSQPTDFQPLDFIQSENENNQSNTLTNNKNKNNNNSNLVSTNENKEQVNNNNISIGKKSPKQFQDVLIPVTTSTKDGSTYTVLENVPIKRTHRRRGSHIDKDSLKCHQCNTSHTPEWRKGPEGPATLCNACGLAYAKKQKLAMAGNGQNKAANGNKNSIHNKISNCNTLTQHHMDYYHNIQSSINTSDNLTISASTPGSLTNPTDSFISSSQSGNKKHTFHEYITPLSQASSHVFSTKISNLQDKPLKSKSVSKSKFKQSNQSKFQKSVSEFPPLNQQVDNIFEKNKITLAQHKQQKKIKQNQFNINNSNNSLNNMGYNNSLNNLGYNNSISLTIASQPLNNNKNNNNNTTNACDQQVQHQDYVYLNGNSNGSLHSIDSSNGSNSSNETLITPTIMDPHQFNFIDPLTTTPTMNNSNITTITPLNQSNNSDMYLNSESTASTNGSFVQIVSPANFDPISQIVPIEEKSPTNGQSTTSFQHSIPSPPIDSLVNSHIIQTTPGDLCQDISPKSSLSSFSSPNLDNLSPSDGFNDLSVNTPYNSNNSNSSNVLSSPIDSNSSSMSCSMNSVYPNIEESCASSEFFGEMDILSNGLLDEPICSFSSVSIQHH